MVGRISSFNLHLLLVLSSGLVDDKGHNIYTPFAECSFEDLMAITTTIVQLGVQLPASKSHGLSPWHEGYKRGSGARSDR